MYYLGLDIGSLSCDAVLVDHEERILASSVVPTGAKNREAIARATDEVLRASGISRSDVKAIVSTGYGRERVEDRLATVTEISCHARGILARVPKTQILIDIGGQDSKAIRIDKSGRVADFAMNDKCAAGTGRFLEAMARALQIDLEEMSQFHGEIKDACTLSSMCTVFAESEVVSLIADGIEMRKIVNGLNAAIAARTVTLVKRIAPNIEGLSISMSGGVARNAGVVRALSEALKRDISIPENPDTIGALGAALIARERAI
ncbi:MAG: 2-hydroxyglutaryl-CoA dehydratase [Deltaproteobacteria bacterium]|nr:2-hydroxyglutaryl-CoA dehydratase [Deltaproteobacteria bacterium]